MICEVMNDSDKHYEDYKSLISEFGDTSKYSKEMHYDTTLENVGKCVFLFYDDDRKNCIGTVSLLMDYKPFHNRGSVRLEEVVVNKNFRKMGYGKDMISFVIKTITTSNEQQLNAGHEELVIYKITLSCKEENVGFYESVGFKRNEVEMRLDVK